MSITTTRGLRTSVSCGLSIQMRRVPSLVSSLEIGSGLVIVNAAAAVLIG